VVGPVVGAVVLAVMVFWSLSSSLRLGSTLGAATQVAGLPPEVDVQARPEGGSGTHGDQHTGFRTMPVGIMG